MYTARADQVGPFKILVAYLPWPEHDKNELLVPNCVRRESKAEGGRLYFVPNAPMWKGSAAAKDYKARVYAQIYPVLPSYPWYAQEPWSVQLTQVRPEGARADVDHHAFVVDNVVSAGLAQDDRYCSQLLLDAQAAPGEEGGLWWFSRQLRVGA